MERIGIIRHQAGLVLRLIDTATGQEIQQAERLFWRNGKPLRPMSRPDGKLIFLAFPPEACELTVQVAHYLPQTVTLTEAQLTQRPPLVELHCIPDASYTARWPCHTLEGEYPAITELDAVRCSDTACLIRSFEERKRMLTVFNPHHLMLERTFYAVVNPDADTYEPIRIEKQVDDQRFRVAELLQQPFRNHFPVARRVLGAVPEPHRYVLRVPADSSSPRWLVRWRSGGVDRFQLVDFLLPETTRLRSPPAEEEPSHS